MKISTQNANQFICEREREPNFSWGGRDFTMLGIWIEIVLIFFFARFSSTQYYKWEEKGPQN